MTADRIRDTIASWQSRLLQLDQRNRLLYFKLDSTAAVQVLVDDITAFLTRLEGSRRGLAFDFQPAASRQRSGWFGGAAQEPTQPPPSDPPVQPGDLTTTIPVRQLQAR